MSQEVLKEYLQSDQDKDCATAAFHALLPKKPFPRSVEAVLDNTCDIGNTVFYIFLEWLKQDIITYIHYIGNKEQPSKFYKDVYELAKINPLYSFIGGLMDVERINGVRHVIAIKNIHKASGEKKVTIVDTSIPTENGVYTRKVPINWLDRRIIKEEEGHFQISDWIYKRAVALTGVPLECFRASGKEGAELISKFDSIKRAAIELRTTDIELRYMTEETMRKLEEEEWMLEEYRSKKQWRREKRMKNI